MAEKRPIPHSAPIVGDEEIRAAERVLRSGFLVQGPEVAALEEECADFCGRRYGVAVSSGTAALHLALIALNVAEGKSVAMPSFVCTALLNAAYHARAIAVIDDVDDNFNPVFSDRSRASALLVAHLFGKSALVPDHPAVIEDIAQALGGSSGKSGRVAVASFYATKLMTSGGEGGMILLDDASMAAHIRDLRDYDNRDDYIPRFNYKMTDLAAAIAREQLKKLPGWIGRRREIAAQYHQQFDGLPLTLPDPQNHVFFRYVISTERRKHLQAHLNDCGIDAKRPVFKPLHEYVLPTTLVRLAPEYPGTDRAYEQALSIPVNPAMQQADIDRVIDSVRTFF